MLTYKILVFLLKPVFAFLCRIKVTGKENIPEGAAIICANHTSLLDPIVLAVGVGYKTHIHFMAKRELFKNKILGAILKKIGVIPVNREAVDLQTIRGSLKVLKEGKKLMLFPEGTRIPEKDAKRENVKMGAGMLAARSQAPIVPVYIPGNKGLFKKTHIIIGKPMQAVSGEKTGNGEYMNTALAVFDEIMNLGKVSK